MTTVTDPDRIIIFDTTLRDGEQSPGASMNLGEGPHRRGFGGHGRRCDRSRISHLVARRFDAVHEIAKQIKNSAVCGLARAVRTDIERVAEAIRPTPRGRIHPSSQPARCT